MAEARERTIQAHDGFRLEASEWEIPDAPTVVLVAPATAVRRRLYAAFADALAARGLAVLTWDWRGTGGSRPQSLRGFAATMRQWAELDLAAAIAWARRRHPKARIAVLGHSFGGQALGLVPDPRAFDRAVTVAAQSGYFGHWPRPRRYVYALLWTVVVPLLCSLCGYFPASRLGLGEDLPAGVARQWARWCRRREYLGDYSGHERMRAPLLAFGFSDDPYAPPRAVAALHRHYPVVTRRSVTPREAGVRRLGHFGFFRLGSGHSLWREAADWLSDGRS
ncbi:MAG: alpha/beta fold hydrolase [Thermoanaerobaculia bacterium]